MLFFINEKVCLPQVWGIGELGNGEFYCEMRYKYKMFEKGADRHFVNMHVKEIQQQSQMKKGKEIEGHSMMVDDGSRAAIMWKEKEHEIRWKGL